MKVMKRAKSRRRSNPRLKVLMKRMTKMTTLTTTSRCKERLLKTTTLLSRYRSFKNSQTRARATALINQAFKTFTTTILRSSNLVIPMY